MSLGEKRAPGTNHGKNSESYLADHPISSHTQSSWRRPKDTLPSLDGGQNLNRTGVLLPDINMAGGVGGGLGGPAYKFEAANRRRPQENASANAN